MVPLTMVTGYPFRKKHRLAPVHPYNASFRSRCRTGCAASCYAARRAKDGGLLLGRRLSIVRSNSRTPSPPTRAGRLGLLSDAESRASDRRAFHRARAGSAPRRGSPPLRRQDQPPARMDWPPVAGAFRVLPDGRAPPEGCLPLRATQPRPSRALEVGCRLALFQRSSPRPRRARSAGQPRPGRRTHRGLGTLLGRGFGPRDRRLQTSRTNRAATRIRELHEAFGSAHWPASEAAASRAQAKEE